jgi:hypothetical protein
MRCSKFSTFIIFVFKFKLVLSLSDSFFPWEDFDESSSDITHGSNSFLEYNMENLDWNSNSFDSQTFDLDDAHLFDSNADIFWDSEPLLADATAGSNFCASQADGLSIEARDDDDVSCSSSRKEEEQQLLLSPETTQLFEDPLGIIFDNGFLPFKGQVEEQEQEKPRYPGLLSEEQIKERERLEGEAWIIHHPPMDSEDPCAPYRSRGYVNNVCCERPWEGDILWLYHLSLTDCYLSTCFFFF